MNIHKKDAFQCWCEGKGDMHIMPQTDECFTTAQAAEWYVRHREQQDRYRPQVGATICVYDGELVFRYRLQMLLTPLSAHDPNKEAVPIRNSQRDGA